MTVSLPVERVGIFTQKAISPVVETYRSRSYRRRVVRAASE